MLHLYMPHGTMPPSPKEANGVSPSLTRRKLKTEKVKQLGKIPWILSIRAVIHTKVLAIWPGVLTLTPPVSPYKAPSASCVHGIAGAMSPLLSDLELDCRCITCHHWNSRLNYFKEESYFKYWITITDSEISENGKVDWLIFKIHIYETQNIFWFTYTV